MGTNDGVTRILNLETLFDRAAELDKLRRNVTVLFTDLKGSTNYFEKFGDSAGLLMVHRCNSMLSEAVVRHGGRVIKTIGDAVMAAFDDAAEAVAASIEMQQAITADNLDKPADHRICVRIGINYGPGIVKSNDVFGDVVNVASRVEGAAAPEQILISDTLFTVVGGTNRFQLRALGKFALKGKSEERNLFEVVWRPESETRTTMAHSLLTPVPDFNAQVRFKLVQVRTDGKPAREFKLRSNTATIGRCQGDFTFPHDEYLCSPHARLSVESGQMFAEPVDNAAVFFSLVGPYRLQPSDIVKIGAQLLEFQVDTAALAQASHLGKGIAEISAVLLQPVAEFVSTRADQKRYPLLQQLTTWGRTKATFTFPTDTSMSRSHAKVYHRGEDFFLEDTGSTNGTFVMAKEKVPIPAGAILSLGGQLLRLIREEPPHP